MIHHSNKITHFKGIFVLMILFCIEILKEGGVDDSYLVPFRTMYRKHHLKKLS